MSLLNNQNSAAYDTSQLVNAIDISKQKQQGLINQGTANLQGLNQPYQDSTAKLGQGLQDQTKAAGEDYLKRTTNASDTLGTNLSQALMRNTMAAQPAINNSLSEHLAATGGLARGGADQAYIQNAADTNRNLYEGNQSIVNQQLADRQAALGTVYGNTSGAINTSYGNNVAANNSVLSNNQAALTNQTNGLVGTESNATNQTLDAYIAQQNANLARSAGNSASNSALAGSLIGAAGTVVGGMYGGPVGAAAGNKLGTVAGNSVTGARGTTNLG